MPVSWLCDDPGEPFGRESDDCELRVFMVSGVIGDGAGLVALIWPVSTESSLRVDFTFSTEASMMLTALLSIGLPRLVP